MFSGCSVGPEEYFGGLGDMEAWIPTLARVLEEFILVGWEPTNAFADTSLFQQIDRKYVLKITCRRCSQCKINDRVAIKNYIKGNVHLILLS